ncbi:MAG: hypothetical protein Q4D85_03795 [Corynebacterium sp.]|uniref:hypothetical protein n=1 Tax=Corynebacterium sp. TaxID=1720 RepID=UPI0026DADD41|nr:hypothetical protein [Corynebacterium sp.]MDO5097857.1 hypothetical protein [Corynebacterium sp.]
MYKNLRLILATSCAAAVALSGTVPANAYQEYVSTTVTVTRGDNGAAVCSYSDYKTTVSSEKEKVVAAELADYSNVAFFMIADRLGIDDQEFYTWLGTDDAELRKPLDAALEKHGFNQQEKTDLLDVLSAIYLAAGAEADQFDGVQRQGIYNDLNAQGNSAQAAAALYAKKIKPIDDLKAIVTAAEAGQGAKNYVQGIEAYKVILKWTEASNAPALKALKECQTKAAELEAQNPPAQGSQTSATQTQPSETKTQPSSTQTQPSETKTQPSSTQNQKPSEQPGDKTEPADKGSSKPAIAGIVVAAIAGLVGLIAVAAPMLAKIFPPLAALLGR